MARFLFSLPVYFIAGLLSSCMHTPSATTPTNTVPSIAPSVPTAVISSPNNSSLNSESLSVESDSASIPTQQKRSLNVEIIKGKDTVFQAGIVPLRHTPDEKGDVTLTFVDADVKQVVREVLGETLGFNYTLDPGVQGKVTLQSSKPLPKDALFGMLEATLRLNNIALVRADGIFHVVPLADAVRRGLAVPTPKTDRGTAQGFGVEIVPLHYVPVNEMRKLLDPFAPKDGVLLADAERNILLLAGTRDELDTMKAIVDAFDIDTLRNRSFGIFAPQYTSVDTLVRELRAIFQETDSGMSDFVKLVPIPRLSKLIAISQQPHYLDSLKEWIERLDEDSDSEQPHVFVYSVQHGKAEDLAGSLSKLFGGDDSYIGHTSEEVTNTRIDSAPRELIPWSNAQPIYPKPPKPATTNVRPVEDTGSLRIIADEKTNSLLIYASTQTFKQIRTALVKLDAAPLQVLIEASIAEVTLTDDLRFGVQWFFESGRNTYRLSSNSNGAVDSRFPGFSHFYRSTDIRAALNALESITHVNVLSSPKLMVLNNQTAMLQVGDQVPVVTQSAVGVLDTGAPIVNSVQLRDTGVILKVTPRINNQGLVQLDIQQEVSDVVPTTTSNIDSPTIQQRKISSFVAVQDGETVALGGLIRDRKSQGNSGVPFLSRIPLMGHLFSETSNNNTRTELIVFITPRVVRDLEQARQATAELREQLQGILPATGVGTMPSPPGQ